MDNNNERSSTPELIDPHPDKSPFTHPEPLPPVLPPTQDQCLSSIPRERVSQEEEGLSIAREEH